MGKLVICDYPLGGIHEKGHGSVIVDYALFSLVFLMRRI